MPEVEYASRSPRRIASEIEIPDQSPFLYGSDGTASGCQGQSRRSYATTPKMMRPYSQLYLRRSDDDLRLQIQICAVIDELGPGSSLVTAHLSERHARSI